MRPIRIEIEGLRSFRARQVIDFSGRDYVAVIGDTGAGKSSILEALTFALYGRTTFSGQGHQELMNASSTALRVVVAFDVGGEHWEVTRTLRRAGTGKVSTGVTSLLRFDDDAKLVEAFDKARDVTAKIEAILGLDDEAFLRTVVLPQGQFSRLLVDDDQKLRASVLRQIWRTDELTEAGTTASDALAELGPLRGRVKQAMDSLPDDPDDHLSLLEAEVARCATVLRSARDRQLEASDAATVLADAATQISRVNKLTTTLIKWDGLAAAEIGHEIEAADRRLIGNIVEVEQLLKASRDALQAVPADEDGYTITETVTFSTVLESIPGLVAQRDGAASRAASVQLNLVATEERLGEATIAEAKAADEVDSLLAVRTELADAAGTATGVLGLGRVALLEARRTASAAADVEERLGAVEALVAQRIRHLVDARAALSESVALHAAVTAVLEGARRAAAAADAGHGLHHGDPCPVCDRELPEGWAALKAPELDAARRGYAQATERLDQAKAAVTLDEGLVASAEEAVESRRQELITARELETAAREALIGHLGGAPDLRRADDELLGDLTRAIAIATAALDAHDTLIRNARATHEIASNEQARAEATHGAKVSELNEAIARRDEASSNYLSQIERLPEALRPTGDNIEISVTQVSDTLNERRRLLDERERTRCRLRGEIETLGTRRQNLGETRRTQIDEPADRLWSAIVAHRSVLEWACEDLAISVTLPGVESRPPIDDLASLIDVITRLTEEVGAAAEAAAQGASASAEAARLVLGRLATGLQLDPNDPPGIVGATTALTEDAGFNHRQAQAAADRFRQRMPAIAALQASGAALEERYLALSDLSAALRDGAFPKWLTLRRSRSLLVHASRLLSEITAGRYAFADLDDIDSQWFVFDSDNGQPRSPSSLSGGEKFVASLALALGMVEMMGRQGDRIESLFLDEGFGALDRTNLDAAVEALGSVAATGRLVAVITHLRAVAEQIDHVLSVTREPTGTKVVWLSNSARSALAEGDLNVPSGLLE